MFRRVEAVDVYFSDTGREVKIYGPRSLPSDGQIRHYINVARGLKERGALSPERCRDHVRLLHAGLRSANKPDGKNYLGQCKGIIIELEYMLMDSPSEHRGRIRSPRRRRNGWRDTAPIGNYLARPAYPY